MYGKEESNEAKELYQKARSYEADADLYMAVKLYRKVIRLAPDWELPHFRMAVLYKNRKEWKPALHYSRVVTNLAPEHEQAWKICGLAATALQNTALANDAWNKLGKPVGEEPQPVAVLLQKGRQQEVVWGRPLDPVRVRLISIPQPAFRRRFNDIVLIDPFLHGYRTVGEKRLDVYEEVALLERSRFQTFCFWVNTDKLQYIDLLAGLCRESGLGFDNWSMASRLLLNRDRQGLLEYPGNPQVSAADQWLVAVAARQKVQLRKVLKEWQSLTSRTHSQPLRVLGWY
ncbi:MAG: hypothetical protein KDC44_02175 [Phaeodactylibacter sp.]|nr:hypothetical protein [Phaeodactylibacter sp.]